MARNRGSNNENKNSQSRGRQRNEAAPRKKSGILGKILCLLLGFVMGVVGTIGGIGGLGYYAITQIKIKDAVGTVNDLAGLEIDYTQYVNEQFGDFTVFGMIQEITGVVEELQSEEGCLNTLNNVSPMVGASVKELIDTVSAYGIRLEYETLMSTPFAGFSDYLSETVKEIEIAGLVETFTQTPVEGLLAVLCYGELGEDYVIQDDGSIKMLGNATPATIGSLMSTDGLGERLNKLTFFSLIDALGDIDTSDPIIRTLVYGVEGEDYIINEDGSITQLPKTYQLSGEVGSQVFTSPDGVEFTCVDGVWKDANENTIQQCEGCEGTPEYQYEVFNANEELICSLKFLEADGDLQYYQVYVSGVAQTRKGPCVSDVLGGDLLSIVGTLPLGTILKLNGNSDSILLAVAYGEKDVDYRIENDKIIPINPPLTINDLIGGNKGIEMIEDIPLATILNIDSPLASGVDKLMIILAYGEEGTHYKLIDTNNDGVADGWDWLTDEEGNPYSERTIGFLMEGNGSDLFNGLTIEMLMDINANSAPLMRSLAYGNEGTHYVLTSNSAVKMLPKRYYITGTNVYDEEHISIGTVTETLPNGIYKISVVGDENAEYLKENPDTGYDVFPSLDAANNYSAANDTRLYHTKTKLSDLRGDMAQNYIERIELAAALGVDIFGTGSNAPDPLMLQLAYGTEDVHYTLDRTNKTITWLKDLDPNSETYGLYFHARTIHDMKDTHALLESIYLDTVLGLDYQSSPIILSLAYGNDYEINGEVIEYNPNTHRTIGDLMGANSGNLIDEIELRKIIKIAENDNAAMMNYILYNMTVPDETKPEYKIRTLGDFMNNSQNIIDGMMQVLTVRQALGEAATNSGILYSLRDATLSNMGEAINNLTLVDVLGESATADGVLYCLRDTKLCDLDQVSEELTLVDLLGDDVADHPILKHISSSTLKTIEANLSSLTIQQLMDKSHTDTIYHYEEIDGDWVKAVDGREVIPTDSNGTRTWKFTDGTAAPSPLKGAWKYLLIDEDGNECLYTMEDMNDAMGNISVNMKKATLYDLDDDGLIKINSSSNVLDTDIIRTIRGFNIYTANPSKTKLGELTVAETIDYLSKMIDFVGQLT